MRTRTFQVHVQNAVDRLPPHIREKLKDVEFVVEDRPEDDGPGLLLGMYDGIPLTEWGRDFSGKMPDRIIIYKEPIEMMAELPRDIPRVIRETVWHEVGHHFGLDHKRIGEMEKRWRKGGVSEDWK